MHTEREGSIFFFSHFSALGFHGTNRHDNSWPRRRDGGGGGGGGGSASHPKSVSADVWASFARRQRPTDQQVAVEWPSLNESPERNRRRFCARKLGKNNPVKPVTLTHSLRMNETTTTKLVLVFLVGFVCLFVCFAVVIVCWPTISTLIRENNQATTPANIGFDVKRNTLVIIMWYTST